MMKKIGEVAPALTILSACVAGVIMFFATQAVAEHNEKTKAHTVLIQQIRDNAAKIVLLKQNTVLTQAQNVLTNKNLADNQTRMLISIDKLHEKVDLMLANR